ncbi:GPI transamidase subunit PIG-U [Lipomyces chichibuensis]|uniref:GPI transamidase subunit PIG-U n=1 Tax=Lipomyces chichibuensis TaxID=1546026 RepID=UPI00334388B1
MDLKTWAVFVASAVLKLSLNFLFPSLHSILGQHVEVTTSMTSFKQLKEGLHLYEIGISPYDGGVYHQAPIFLLLFKFLGKCGSTSPNSPIINVFYVFADIITAYFLCAISKSPSLAKTNQLADWVIASIYLFNPLVVATNIARSTAVLSNAAMIGSIAYACYNWNILSVMFLALASHANIYSVYLLPPFLVLWTSTTGASTASVIKYLTLYIAMSTGLASIGYFMTGSLQYLTATYGSLLFFKDLAPNMGLWWYFFMEMFDFFRPLFTYIFQLYSLIYVLPITFRLHNYPLMAITCIVGMTTISKSYPEVGDLGVYISLLSLFRFIFPNVRYALLAALVILHSLVLAPSFYHLWIYLGSGNANFFYAITLVYTIGMTIIITDTLRATLLIEFQGTEDPSKAVIQI